MKKLIIAILLISNVVIGYSQSYTPEQEELRTEISDYLREQGLNPENQSDGIKFKSEGDTYYVEIDEESKDPMYVRLRRYIKYNDTFNKEKIATELNNYNIKYGVKVFCQEESFVLSAEMYLTKASEFNYAFSELLNLIKSTYTLINE